MPSLRSLCNVSMFSEYFLFSFFAGAAVTVSPKHTSVIEENTTKLVEQYKVHNHTVIIVIGSAVLFLLFCICGKDIFKRLKKKKKAPSESFEMNNMNDENTIQTDHDSSQEAGQRAGSSSSGNPDCLIEKEVEVVVHDNGAVQSVVHTSSGMV